MVGIEGLLPRSVYRYELRLTRVLDLTDPAVLDHLETTTAQLVCLYWGPCQRLGSAAYAIGDQAIRSPSATGVDNVIAVFTEHVGPSLTRVELHQQLHELEGL